MTDARVARIIDANLNRLTEGLRVVEDVARLALADRRLLAGIRRLRTQVGEDVRQLRRRFIPSRQSETDPGRAARFDRAGRKHLDDVLFANFKRAEEAARVLEEMLKLAEPKLAAKLKAVRFELYTLEKQALLAISQDQPQGKPQTPARPD